MFDRDIIREAGKKLRQRREDVGFTQLDVETKTRENPRFGETLAMKGAHLSQIERGTIKRPPSIDDLVPLCWVLNLSLEEVTAWYGLGAEKSTPVVDEPAIVRVKKVLAGLPKDSPQRQRLLDMIDFAAASVSRELVTA